MASEIGRGQTEGSNIFGVADDEIGKLRWTKGLGRPVRECESHVVENEVNEAGSRVPRDTRNPVGSRGDHPPSQNTTQ